MASESHRTAGDSCVGPGTRATDRQALEEPGAGCAWPRLEAAQTGWRAT